MNNIEEIQQNYFEPFDSFCFQNSIKNILESYGVEDALDYLSMGISIKCMNSKDIKLFHETWEESLLYNYRNYMKINFSNPSLINEVMDENRKLINIGYPLIIVCDTYYLPYTSYYNKTHGNHTVIMYGMDKIQKTVKISDCFHNWYYKGEIGEEVIRKARKSRNPFDGGLFSGEPINLAWAMIEKSVWDGAKGELIRENLMGVVQNYYMNKDKDYLYGKEAYEFIGFKLAKTQEQEFYYKLYFEFYYYVKKRGLFAYYLSTLLDSILFSIKYFIERYNGNLAKWKMWLNIVLKEGLTEKGRMKKNIYDNYKWLIEEEAIIINELDKIISVL